MKINWKNHGTDRVARSESTVGTRSNPRAQLDHQPVLGVRKVIAMEVLIGHRIIVRVFNVTNMVDLVAGKALREKSLRLQILAYRLVRLFVRSWEF